MQPSDIALYSDIAHLVGQGAPYYETVAELHRARDYPLFPFYTVRLPTLAYLMGYVGPVGMLLSAYGLLLAGIAAWFRQLQDETPLVRVGFLALYAWAGGALISPVSIQAHDVWAGLLVSLALGLGWNWRLQLLAAMLAVLIRELALPILILLWATDWKNRAYPVAIMLFVSVIVLHYLNVASVRLPSDAPSQGWDGLRGPAGFVEHFSVFLPHLGYLAFVPLLGWVRRPIAGLWFAGIIFAICVFARPDNLYWTTMILPAFPAGAALLLGVVGVRNRRAHAVAGVEQNAVADSRI